MQNWMCRFSVLVLLLAGPALADGPRFAVDGRHSVRFNLDGERDLTDGEFAEEFRHLLRLGITAELGDRVTLAGAFQDVRVWGQESGTYAGDTNTTDLYQGFVLVDAIQGDAFNLTVEIGRRGWSYRGKRLFDLGRWSMREQRFDGARVHMTGADWAVDLFYAKIGESDTVVHDNDQDLMGCHGELALGDHVVTVDAMAELDDASAAEMTRITAGAHADGRAGAFSYRVEGYAQLGSVGDADLFAFFAGGDVGVSLLEGRLSVRGGAEFSSGDDDPDAGDVGHFDNRFAAKHAYYGYVDFFLDIPRDTGRRGLLDAWAQIVVKPLRTLKIKAVYHHFRLAVEDAAGNTALGDEIDLVVVWTPFEPFTLAVGGGVMLGQQALGDLRGAGPERDAEPWFHTQVTTVF